MIISFLLITDLVRKYYILNKIINFWSFWIRECVCSASMRQWPKLLRKQVLGTNFFKCQFVLCQSITLSKNHYILNKVIRIWTLLIRECGCSVSSCSGQNCFENKFWVPMFFNANLFPVNHSYGVGQNKQKCSVIHLWQNVGVVSMR